MVEEVTSDDEPKLIVMGYSPLATEIAHKLDAFRLASIADLNGIQNRMFFVDLHTFKLLFLRFVKNDRVFHNFY